MVKESQTNSLKSTLIFIDSKRDIYQKLLLYRFISNDSERREKLTCQNINYNSFEKLENCDVNFIVQGKKIPAHKSVLSASCKFFENLFASMKLICS